MDEDVRKRGVLYLQQQRFGKKWRKVWSSLYQENTRSVSRLEFFEWKDGSGAVEKSSRKQDNRKVIKLSDCIRVLEAEVEGCPRDCRPFLVETTEKMFVFAAETAELSDWMQKLCEIAFPWGERRQRHCSQPQTETKVKITMSDNSLYDGRETAMKDFKVTIKRTEASERCALQGAYLLRTGMDRLLLKDTITGLVCFNWPYRFLRRFGRDKTTFSFEAGRRCDSGEGNFEFVTKQGNTIFQSVEAAINVHRTTLPLRKNSGGGGLGPHSLPCDASVPGDQSGTYSMVKETAVREAPAILQPHRSRLDAPTDKLLTGVKSLTLDTRPPPRKNQVKNFRSCPLASTEDQTYSKVSLPALERDLPRGQDLDGQPSSLPPLQDPDYSLPFDTIAKNLADILSASHSLPTVLEPCQERRGEEGREPAEPLYDSIDESAIRQVLSHKAKSPLPTYKRTEHIYDEPEGCALAASGPMSLYDDPEEVKGHAWKILGTPLDPSGHEYPYNSQRDDYSVPKGRRVFVSEPLEQPDGTSVECDEDSPYDNVMLK